MSYNETNSPIIFSPREVQFVFIKFKVVKIPIFYIAIRLAKTSSLFD